MKMRKEDVMIKKNESHPFFVHITHYENPDRILVMVDKYVSEEEGGDYLYKVILDTINRFLNDSGLKSKKGELMVKVIDVDGNECCPPKLRKKLELIN